MNADSQLTIDAVGSAPLGSSVEFEGVVTMQRCLGKVTFLVAQDITSTIQVYVEGALHTALADVSPPYYAQVKGRLAARPRADVRRDGANGAVEVQATSVKPLLGAGPVLARPPLDWREELVGHLQARGFRDIRTLAQVSAPRYVELLASEEALSAARHLARILGPCCWYLMTSERLHFGGSPARRAQLEAVLEEESTLTKDAQAVLATIRWDEVAADYEAGDPGSAWATIEIDSRLQDAPVACATSYLRHLHAIEHLRDDLIDLAARRPRLDDAAVRTLSERLARSQALLDAMSGKSERSSISPILRDLDEFDLHVEHTEVMLELFPSLEKKLTGSTGDEQFELLWSILGHDHVKEVFSSPQAVERLRACVRAGMFTDFNILRSLNPETLESIHVLSRGHEDPEACALLNSLFAGAPHASASACYLMREVVETGGDWRDCVPLAQTGCISRLAFAAAARGEASIPSIKAWRRALAENLRFLFSNLPVDGARCISALDHSAISNPWVQRVREVCTDTSLVFDLVHLTYGHGIVAYAEAARMYENAADSSEHWSSAGFNFEGRRWNPDEGRFELSGLWLYPSKNRAAILSKSCSGICSARNADLFHREDHFQFTLVDPNELVAVGSLQMYDLFDAEGRRLWVVRGLNPSEKATIEPLGFTYEVLDTLAGLAAASSVDTLACADGAGLFSADSSRVALRAILRRSATGTNHVRFAGPLHIFDYHDREISIEHGWQIWP